MKRCWLALWLVLGCDGFGKPVVGEFATETPRLFKCSESMFDCASAFRSRAPFPAPQAVSNTGQCVRGPREACEAPRLTSCVLALRVVEGIPVMLPEQSCITLDLTPAPESTLPELRGLSARSSTFLLHAERPTTFRLSEVALAGVAIELSGPVALELQGDLKNVSITSADAVQVEISGSIANTLTTRLPAGSLRVKDTRLDVSKLHAREIVLETVPLADLELKAERLVGIELEGERTQLDVGDLSLSEVEVTGLELHRCDSALLVNARLSQAMFAPCSDRLRAHSSAINGSRATGRIESLGTFWSSSLFGGGMNTTLEMWGGTLTTSALCPALQRLTVTEQTAISCVDCRTLQQPEEHVCKVAEAPLIPLEPNADAGILMGTNVLCPIFDQGLPRCDPAPVPTSPL